MFWIWVTVATTWLRKAISEISRLFFAIRMNRRLGPRPKPESRRWRTVARKDELIAGTRVSKRLLVVRRELFTPTSKLVPVAHDCVYSKFTDVEFCCRTGVPVVTVLVSGNEACSTCVVDTSVGS